VATAAEIETEECFTFHSDIGLKCHIQNYAKYRFIKICSTSQSLWRLLQAGYKITEKNHCS